MSKIQSDEQLTELLIRPGGSDVDFARKLQGDAIILGAGGKMGPTLARRLKLAIEAAGGKNRVIAVSRYESSDARRELDQAGIETIAADLLDPANVQSLPPVENVYFLAGRKFGSTADPELTWAMNTLVPAWVAQHYRASRIVAFSTGNIYPFVRPESGGCVETDAPAPIGEYAQSCLGRERVFEYYSRKFNTPCLIFRLNYAIDLRYGVLVDIAKKIYERRPVDVSVPAVNVLWQGDANSYALRSLELCESPARVLNVTGPETISVQRAANYFAKRFGLDLVIEGEPGRLALLNNAGACHSALGYPAMTSHDLMDAVADWVESGGASLNKETKFQVTDGKF